MSKIPFALTTVLFFIALGRGARTVHPWLGGRWRSGRTFCGDSA